MKLCSCDPEFPTASVYGQPAFASAFLEIILFIPVICMSTLFIAIPLIQLIKILFSDETELLMFPSVLIWQLFHDH